MATSTTSGDLLVAVYYTYASACVTATANTGWTIQGSPTCTSTKHNAYILTATATGEVSDQPLSSVSSAAYQNVIIYEFSSANTSAPIDVISSYSALAGTTTPAAPGLTTTQNGDMLVSSWMTSGHVATANSVSGYTQIDENNAVYLSSAYQAQTTAGTVSGPTITYASANTSGETVSFAVVPAAAGPTSYPVDMLVKMYWGNGNGGCAGYDPGAATLQSLFAVVENCGGSGFSISTLATECATGCLPETYVSPVQIECNPGGAYETGFYNYLDASDESGFLHISGTAHTASNRLYYNKGSASNCPLSGQISGSTGTGPYYLFTNPGDTNANSWYLTNVYEATNYFPTNRFIAFEDDMGIGPPAYGYNSLVSDEYQTVSTWRTAIGTHDNALCLTPLSATCYFLEDNSLGPGGGRYETNNATGSLAGVVNGQVDVEDVCNTATQNNRKGFTTEDPMWSAANGFMRGNVKVLINTASDMWATTSCAGQFLDDLEESTSTQSTEDQIRRVRTAFDWILSPNDSSRRVMFWTYNICHCATESAFLPEYLIVPQQPEQTLGKWHWNGTSDYSGCPLGSTPGSGTDAGGDTGGVVNVAFACVSADAGRTGGAVYIRQFKQCIVAGVAKGPCAAVLNATSQPFTYSSVTPSGDAWSTYLHYVTWTGFELPSVTIGSTSYPLCSSGAANCNGTGPLFTSAFSSSNTLAAGDAALIVGW